MDPLLASTGVVYDGPEQSVGPTPSKTTASSSRVLAGTRARGRHGGRTTMDALDWLRKQLDARRRRSAAGDGARVRPAVDGRRGRRGCAAPATASVRPERVNQRNGYRERPAGHPGRDDRAGDPEAAAGQLLPGLAAGAPPARRAGAGGGGGRVLRARGVHPAGRGLGETLGIEGISKSQVSRHGRRARREVAEFRNRPWMAAPTPMCGWTP